MDVMVTDAQDGKTWRLTDLFGRSMGSIEQQSSTEFVLLLEGQAVVTMAMIQKRAFASLDAVLAEIEKQTRGVCRRVEPPRDT